MYSDQNNNRVAFSVTNCICHDQRVRKIAETASRLNCEITIIGRKRGDCCDNDIIPFKTRRFRMFFQKGVLFYVFYSIRLFFYLLFHRFDIIVSNDLDTLLPNFLISRLKRIPLIYDSHEYFTGVPEIKDRSFVKWVWKTIEKTIFPHLRYIMTVSDSIAVQYEKQYGIKPVTVRNCSRKSVNIIPFSRKEMGVNEHDLLLLLQGTGINADRGGIELIEAISITRNVTLLIVGSGYLIGVLKGKVIKLNISDRVKFIERVPWEEMMRFTKTADAGLSLDKDTNLNYRFSLPNKLFDYISAGIPAIVSDLPEVSRIVRENNCGIVIQNVSPEVIAGAIMELNEDPVLLSRLKRNAAIASESINWENESAKVKSLYEFVLSHL